jgi:hypothetical protein
MPLEYVTFGTAKQELDGRTPSVMPWVEKAQMYKDILLEGPMAATIKAYQSRLKACINVGGKHVRMSRKKEGNS